MFLLFAITVFCACSSNNEKLYKYETEYKYYMEMKCTKNASEAERKFKILYLSLDSEERESYKEYSEAMRQESRREREALLKGQKEAEEILCAK